ncbi:MAG TPA: ABC transporter ATP-binding protein, partial [Patescibacteria group bacterium]|nr:ABC transporter ATP-binding protein [Patescibacteria group bacterium]
MGNIAELRNVTKVYGNLTAVDDITLQVSEAEILALLGPNGSGKSTLLKMLAIILQPSTGDVYFQGVQVNESNIEQMRMESTLVFQKTVLFTSSVYDNVAYGLKIRKLPERTIEEEVQKALELVRLEGFEKRQAKKLSGGEQQRVALARALVLKTKLLLLDEPTANLDPKNASIVEEAIGTVNRERKTTVIMATHNMLQAKNLPTRIALIENGRIGEVGKPQEIFARLSKTFASFAAVENTLIGEARIANDGTTLVDIGNDVNIVAVTRKTGKISVFISPDDIILSK